MSTDWIQFEFLRNSLFRWAVFLGLWFVLWFAFSLARKILIDRLGRWAEKTETEWDDLAIDLLKATRRFFIFVTALYFASFSLEKSLRVEQVTRSIFVVIALFQAGFWGTNLIEFVIQQIVQKRSKESGEIDSALATTLPTIRFFASIFLFSLLILLGLDNFGINVTALLAGLGVGGIAVALAAQNILGDIFASLSIVIDKPFVIGDLITIGTSQGTVEKIGLKTTRIRSITGEQIIVANTDMLKSRIQNFKRMRDRRVTFCIGVSYDTPTSLVEKIPSIMAEILHTQKQVRIDRIHFKSFGTSSLDFEIVYWVMSSDMKVYMDIQQGINFEILRRFEKEKIQIAYPTQTVFVHPASSFAKENF